VLSFPTARCRVKEEFVFAQIASRKNSNPSTKPLSAQPDSETKQTRKQAHAQFWNSRDLEGLIPAFFNTSIAFYCIVIERRVDFRN